MTICYGTIIKEGCKQKNRDHDLEEEKRYKGRDLNQKELPKAEIEHADIRSAAGEICKNITVD